MATVFFFTGLSHGNTVLSCLASNSTEGALQDGLHRAVDYGELDVEMETVFANLRVCEYRQEWTKEKEEEEEGRQRWRPNGAEKKLVQSLPA